MPDESLPPRPPRPTTPPMTPGKPMPRVWKAEPTPEAAPAVEKKTRKERLAEERAERDRKAGKSKKSKSRAADGEDDGKKPIIAPTPELDTYQTRTRIRMALTAGLALLAVVGVVVLFRSFSPPASPPPPDIDEAAVEATPTPVNKAESAENTAQGMLANAQRLASLDKPKEALELLRRIGSNYSGTKAAASARQALERAGKKLPLFLNGPVIVAEGTPKPRGDAPPPERPPVVTAESPTPPRPPAGGNDARVTLPSNPAEQPRSAPPNAAASGTNANRLPSGFTARLEAGLHVSGWPNQITSDRDGAVLVLIPGGTFIQGRNQGTPEEGPEHKVTLAPFYIDQHETTVRQYNLFLKETGAASKAAGKAAKPASPGAAADEELPVGNVTAAEARDYCEWAGKKLPTEAQWEAAARTTDGRSCPWGSSPPDWKKPRLHRQIDRVMAFDLDQSPYGVFDLGGNAWEWTRDWYDSRYYKDLAGSVADNPTGPASSRSKPPQIVVKGGSKVWVAAWRDGLRGDTRYPFLGFRGVLPLPAGAAGTAPAPSKPTARQDTPPALPNGLVPF